MQIVRNSKKNSKVLKKNLPNIITLLRIPLTIIFLKSIYDFAYNNYDIRMEKAVGITIFIYLSDFFDGRVARRLNICTRLGSILDVYADLFYILSCLILFNYMKIIPIYFTIVVIFKFVEFNLTTYIINRYRIEGKDKYFSDIIGKMTSIGYYSIPFLIIIMMIYNDLKCNKILDLTMLVLTFTSILSTIIRCKYCLKVFKRGEDGYKQFYNCYKIIKKTTKGNGR